MGHKHSILKNNISDLIPKGQVLQHIPTKASCEEATAMLRNSGISCLPIVYEEGVVQGTVSFASLARHLVKVNFDKFAYLNANVRAAESHTDTLFLPETTTIIEAVIKMVRNGSHYIAVHGKHTSEIRGIVSQSDMVTWLYHNRATLVPDRKDMLLMISDLGSPEVGATSENAPIRDACFALVKEGVDAIAIVDETGAMVAALTPPSFRNLSAAHFPDFNLPVKTFEMEGRDPGWIEKEESLEDVMHKLSKSNIHRLWIVSDTRKPVKIITLTDILRHFLREELSSNSRNE